MDTVDNLQFGNISQEGLYWLTRETYLDKHTTALTVCTFPKNSSPTTKKELDAIIDSITRIKNHPDVLQHYKALDRKGFYFYEEFIKEAELIENKEECLNMLKAIMADTSPMIFKLKQYFQRPRPFQLGLAHKVRLFPFKSPSSDTPSYPSATVYHARVICNVLGNHYPQLYNNMQVLFTDICDARMCLGLNYQSDIDMAIYAADMVLEDQEFKVKYKL